MLLKKSKGVCMVRFKNYDWLPQCFRVMLLAFGVLTSAFAVSMEDANAVDASNSEEGSDKGLDSKSKNKNGGLLKKVQKGTGAIADKAQESAGTAKVLGAKVANTVLDAHEEAKKSLSSSKTNSEKSESSNGGSTKNSGNLDSHSSQKQDVGMVKQVAAKIFSPLSSSAGSHGSSDAKKAGKGYEVCTVNQIIELLSYDQCDKDDEWFKKEISRLNQHDKEEIGKYLFENEETILHRCFALRKFVLLLYLIEHQNEYCVDLTKANGSGHSLAKLIITLITDVQYLKAATLVNHSDSPESSIVPTGLFSSAHCLNQLVEMVKKIWILLDSGPEGILKEIHLELSTTVEQFLASKSSFFALCCVLLRLLTDKAFLQDFNKMNQLLRLMGDRLSIIDSKQAAYKQTLDTIRLKVVMLLHLFLSFKAFVDALPKDFDAKLLETAKLVLGGAERIQTIVCADYPKWEVVKMIGGDAVTFAKSLRTKKANAGSLPTQSELAEELRSTPNWTWVEMVRGVHELGLDEIHALARDNKQGMDNQGRTLVDAACSANNPAVLAAILSANPEQNYSTRVIEKMNDRYNCTDCISLLANNADAKNKTLLHKAAEAGNIREVQGLILLGAEVNRTNIHGWTAAHYACRNKTEVAAKILDLLQHEEADLRAKTRKKMSVVNYALIKRNVWAVEFLSEYIEKNLLIILHTKFLRKLPLIGRFFHRDWNSDDDDNIGEVSIESSYEDEDVDEDSRIQESLGKPTWEEKGKDLA